MPVRSVLRRAVRSAPVRGLLSSGVVRAAALARGVSVFLYHEVSDAPSEFHETYRLNVPPAVFERQIRGIAGHFNVISAHDLISGAYSTPAALITFDDGSAGYFDNALPILRRHGCPSLIFLNMAPVQGEVFWSGLITYLCLHRTDFVGYLERQVGKVSAAAPFLHATPALVERFLDKEDQATLLQRVRDFHGPFAEPRHLASVAGDPDVAFGNHLYNHYNCVSLDRDRLKREFLRNEEALAAYPNKVPLFSYPFGQPLSCYNHDTHEVLRSLGATILFSALPGINYGRQALMHRVAPTADVQETDELVSWLVVVALRQMLRRPHAADIAQA